LDCVVIDDITYHQMSSPQGDKEMRAGTPSLRISDTIHSNSMENCTLQKVIGGGITYFSSNLSYLQETSWLQYLPKSQVTSLQLNLDLQARML